MRIIQYVLPLCILLVSQITCQDGGPPTVATTTETVVHMAVEPVVVLVGSGSSADLDTQSEDIPVSFIKPESEAEPEAEPEVQNEPEAEPEVVDAEPEAEPESDLVATEVMNNSLEGSAGSGDFEYRKLYKISDFNKTDRDNIISFRTTNEIFQSIESGFAVHGSVKEFKNCYYENPDGTNVFNILVMDVHGNSVFKEYILNSITNFEVDELMMGENKYGLDVIAKEDLKLEDKQNIVNIEIDIRNKENYVFLNINETLAEGSRTMSFVYPLVNCDLSGVDSFQVIVKDGSRYLNAVDIKHLLAAAGIDVVRIYHSSDIVAVEFNELTTSQKNNIITVELEPLDDDVILEGLAEDHYQMISGIMVAENIAGHVIYVKPKPSHRQNHNIHISFIVSDKNILYHSEGSSKVIQAMSDQNELTNKMALKNFFYGLPSYNFVKTKYRDIPVEQRDSVISLEISPEEHQLDSRFISEEVRRINTSILENINATTGTIEFIYPTPFVHRNKLILTFFVADVSAQDLLTASSSLSLNGSLVTRSFVGEVGGQTSLFTGFGDLNSEEQRGLCTVVVHLKEPIARSNALVMGNRIYDLVVIQRNLTRDLGMYSTVTEDNPAIVRYHVFTALNGHIDDAHTTRREVKRLISNLTENKFYTIVKVHAGVNDTLKPADYNTVSYLDMSEDQLDHFYTVTYEAQGMDEDDMLNKRDHFNEMFIVGVNIVVRSRYRSDHVDPTGHRSKRSPRQDEDDYEDKDMKYLQPSPRMSDDQVEMVFLVENQEGNTPTNEEVAIVLDNMKQEEPDMTSAVKGIPLAYVVTLPPPSTTEPAAVVYISSSWDDHRFLFLALVILAIVCFIILIIGLACIRYRSNRGSWTRKDDEDRLSEPGNNYDLAIENPITDEEIMKSEAPMIDNCEAPPPRVDQDNGWMIPLEQGKHSVENTKL